MKQVATLLLVAVALSGCGSNRTVQSTAGGTWQAQLLGGTGATSGFSFNTQFTVNGDGSLDVRDFQFLTHNTSSCFPINGGTISGNVVLMVNTNDTVTGTMTFGVQSNENTLSLTGNVTGTATVTGSSQNLSTTLTGATVSGNWTLAPGSGSQCTPTGGSFTMSQGK